MNTFAAPRSFSRILSPGLHLTGWGVCVMSGGAGDGRHGAQQPPPEDPVPPEAEAGAGGDAARVHAAAARALPPGAVRQVPLTCVRACVHACVRACVCVCVCVCPPASCAACVSSQRIGPAHPGSLWLCMAVQQNLQPPWGSNPWDPKKPCEVVVSLRPVENHSCYHMYGAYVFSATWGSSVTTFWGDR